MWQIEECEKIRNMWYDKIQTVRRVTEDRNTKNVRPVEIEVLGVDSKNLTYFYLGGKDL